MATPVAHALLGATSGLAVEAPAGPVRRGLVGAALGCAADLDFIPGLLAGEAARFHHTFSHSLGFAAIVALLAVLVANRDRFRWAMFAFAAYSSHLVLDVLTADPAPPKGVPLLWPVVKETFLSPLTPIPPVIHTGRSVFNAHNFGLAAVELLVFGFLLLAVWRHVRSRGAGSEGSRPAAPPEGSREP